MVMTLAWISSSKGSGLISLLYQLINLTHREFYWSTIEINSVGCESCVYKKTRRTGVLSLYVTSLYIKLCSPLYWCTVPKKIRVCTEWNLKIPFPSENGLGKAKANLPWNFQVMTFNQMINCFLYFLSRCSIRCTINSFRQRDIFTSSTVQC